MLVALGPSAVAAQDDDEEARAATGSDFVDTRLTLTFGDDDFLSPRGERFPLSPAPGFGDRPGYELFYDNLNTRFTGRENVTHLVLHREMPAFADDVTTEAAMVVRFDLETATLSDTGSYLRIRYEPFDDAPDDGLSVTVFPFESDRIRLGHLWAVSFGGSDFLPNDVFVRAPGLKAELVHGAGTYWVGFKAIPSGTDTVVQPDDGSVAPPPAVIVDDLQYAGLAGVGLRMLGERLRLDLSGGAFQQGIVDLPGYPRSQIWSVGGAARVAWTRDMELEESLDVRLYENDPNAPFLAFRPVEYVPGHLSYAVSVEASVLAQRLGDSDAVGQMRVQPAVGGAARVRVQYDYLRVELTSVYRDVPFLLRNVSGVAPALTVPDAADASPELFFSLAADYHFPSPHLTLGLSGGLSLPARIEASGTPTTVLRDGRPPALLPDTADVTPVVAARAHARLDLSEMLYGRLWLQLVYDQNTAPLAITDSDGARRVTQNTLQLGAGITLAARF